LFTGCDVDAGDYDLRTPLMLAAADGNATCVHYLLYAGADVNLQDRWGGTALCDAVRGGHALACRLIYASGGNLGAMVPPGWPPTQTLMSSSEAGEKADCGVPVSV
jgi:hypothetical protein